MCVDIVEYWQTTIKNVSDGIGVKKESVKKALGKNEFKSYKPEFIYTLKDHDFDIRLEFCFGYQGEKEFVSILFHFLCTKRSC